MVVGPGIKVEIGMGSFTVHAVSQRTVWSSVNIYVKEWEVTFTFGLHGELNALMYPEPPELAAWVLCVLLCSSLVCWCSYHSHHV
jgi:hypothetical protein